MRLLEWESACRTIRGIQLRRAAKPVAKPDQYLDTCVNVNMFRSESRRHEALTKDRHAGDDVPPHWRFGETTLSWLSRSNNSWLEELK
jgi:hypothetical protein